MLGTHRHGFGRYDAMCADPDLCFRENLDKYARLVKAAEKVIAVETDALEAEAEAR